MKTATYRGEAKNANMETKHSGYMTVTSPRSALTAAARRTHGDHGTHVLGVAVHLLKDVDDGAHDDLPQLVASIDLPTMQTEPQFEFSMDFFERCEACASEDAGVVFLDESFLQWPHG